MSMELRAESIAVGCGIFAFYHLTSAAVQAFFFTARRASCASWKVQPSKGRELLGTTTPWLPFLPSSKPGRPAWHAALMLFNSVLAAAFAAATAEAFMRGRTATSSLPDLSRGLAFAALRVAGELVAATLYQLVLEYWWHRLMHTKTFYGAFHKLHHTYKSPTPWDDMMIHPLEAAVYYCILYSPCWLMPLSLPSFGLYMALHGLAGIADHSGVHLVDPTGLYNAAEHDLHHEAFNVNFGFPFMWLDRLHGTYAEPRARPSGRGGKALDLSE